MPALTQTLLGSVEVAQSGIASGTLTTMRQTGSMVGVALFGTLIATPGHFFAGLHAALLVSIAALLLGVAFAPFLSAVPGRASPASRRVTSISS